MVNYEDVLVKFYGEIIVYLTRRLKKAKDKFEFDEINRNIERLKDIKANPVFYSDYDVRVKHNKELDAEAFGCRDNTYRLYADVAWFSKDLNSPYSHHRSQAQEVLQKAYREIKIRNAKNGFQKIKFKLQSLEKIMQNYNQR